MQPTALACMTSEQASLRSRSAKTIVRGSPGTQCAACLDLPHRSSRQRSKSELPQGAIRGTDFLCAEHCQDVSQLCGIRPVYTGLVGRGS